MTSLSETQKYVTNYIRVDILTLTFIIFIDSSRLRQLNKCILSIHRISYLDSTPISCKG